MVSTRRRHRDSEPGNHARLLRRYVALLNPATNAPITALHYFTNVIAEVNQLVACADYWTYVGRKLADLEGRWIAHRAAIAHARQSETEIIMITNSNALERGPPTLPLDSMPINQSR